MSKSSSKSKSIRGSLARSYRALSENKKVKDEALARTQLPPSAVAGVKAKITDKQERDVEKGLQREDSMQTSLPGPSKPININSTPDEAVNGNKSLPQATRSTVKTQSQDPATRSTVVMESPELKTRSTVVTESPDLATRSTVQTQSPDSALGASASTQATVNTEYSDEILGEKQKTELAEALLDPQQLWEGYFSGCIDDAANAVEENVEEGTVTPSHFEETLQAKKRGEHRFATVCNFPLKLIFTPLQRGRRMANTFASLLEMQFGPLHAALQVGSVILEWNDSNLVAPYLCDYEDQIMQLNVQPYSEWVKYTGKHLTKVKTAIDGLDYGQQIELIYKIASEKTRLIDALIGVIIKYNKFYYYNLFDRNCQHFVADALQALEVELPNEFKGGLGEYYKTLVKGKTPSLPTQFKKHSDLDFYVMRKKQEGLLVKMPQHDLEYILALYFRFHLEAKTGLKGDPKALESWTCPEPWCCAKELEELIDYQSMKIHQFKTIS